MADKETDVARRDPQRLARPAKQDRNPFEMLERFADEMDRAFAGFGLGRGWLAPRWGRGGSGAPAFWAPDIEVSEQHGELVVRADLPGLKRDDVRVDVTEDALTIQGERRQEEKVEEGGMYRSERSYGSFCRTIPLPSGAMIDQAKATFKDGVLEITIPAPPESATRGRQVEISGT